MVFEVKMDNKMDLFQNIDNSHLSLMVSLQVLDLSRNNLVKLSPGTFVGLTELSYLDVGVNSLRTVSKSTVSGKISIGITTLFTVEFIISAGFF